MTPTERAREVLERLHVGAAGDYAFVLKHYEANVAILSEAFEAVRAEAIEEAAEMVRTWAEDHRCVVPYFTRMANAIRSIASPPVTPRSGT